MLKSGMLIEGGRLVTDMVTVPLITVPTLLSINVCVTSTSVGGTSAEYDENVVKVSIVGMGMRSHAGIAARMFEILAAENINIQAISTSEIKVSCLMATKYSELAVRALHDGFGLGNKP